VFTGVNHICIVTADLDGAVRRWWDRYGIGPWRVFSYDRSNMRAKVDGEAVEVKMRAALAGSARRSGSRSFSPWMSTARTPRR
jgi:methylmalonyl-CoA/ethylmalonyl-CoA epimerase